MSKRQSGNLSGWATIAITLLAVATIVGIVMAILKVIQEGQCAGSAIVLVLCVLMWVPLQNVRMR